MFEGQSILVLGLAKSGEAVARLLIEQGAIVTVSDASTKEEVLAQAKQLEVLGITIVLGDHPLELLDQCDLVVKNPGIPYDRPILVEASKRAIPITTEIEIASRLTKAPFIAITGSNGKTTTTMLVDAMLTHAEIVHEVGGNVGTPVTEMVRRLTPATWMVTEMSSFQLKAIQTFRPKIAAWINLYPTHLDYHGDIADYIASKAKVFCNQSADDFAVINVDYPEIVEQKRNIVAHVVEVSTKRPVEYGAYLDDDNLVWANGRNDEIIKLMPTSDLALRGDHNIENALVAFAIATIVGVPLSSILAVLTSFRGVEHRLEYVREVAGVTYYNNSKATNPQATLRALRSFSEPIVCILGGLERGDDLTVLRSALQERVRAVIALGQSQKRMIEEAHKAGILEVYEAIDIEDAVRISAQIARSGDIVLLAPAAASWDMYRSFEERGRIFKDAVHRL